MHKEATKIKLKSLCNRCGKSVGAQQSSITNWIFRRESCICSDGSTPSLAKERLVAVPTAFELGLPESFRVESILGKGGMGTVFKVIDTRNNAVFAIKLLDRSLESSDKEKLSASLEQELHIAKELTHANIVSIYDYGETSHGIPYLVMDCIDGQGLDCLLESEVFLEHDRAIDIFVQVCEAMAHAHARGVIHRDLKPSNILLSREDESSPVIAKVSDFGIARIVPSGTQRIAESTEVIGSPFYMSPEQCRGDALDHRTDIYSLGCMLFEALTGAPPFLADNPVQIVLKHLQEEPRIHAALKRLEVPQSLEMIILHCLKKSPEDRYQHMDEIIMDLDFVRDGKPPLVAQQQETQCHRDQSAKTRRWQIVSIIIVVQFAYLAHMSRFHTYEGIARMYQSFVFFCMFCLAGGVPLFMFLRPLRNTWIRFQDKAFIRPGDRWLFLVILAFCLYGALTIINGMELCIRISEIDIALTGHQIPDNWFVMTYVSSTLLSSLVALHIALICTWLWRSRKALKHGEVTSGW